MTSLRARFINFALRHSVKRGLAKSKTPQDVRRVFTQLMRRGVPIEQLAERSVRPDGSVPNMVEIVHGPDGLGEPFLSEDELQVFVRAFEKSGFTGGINWYRNLDRYWERTPHLAGARIDVPSLMVTAEHDPVLRPEMAEQMRSFMNDVEIVMIPDCGHWTQQERPEALNRLMIDWLQRRHRAA